MVVGSLGDLRSLESLRKDHRSTNFPKFSKFPNLSTFPIQPRTVQLVINPSLLALDAYNRHLVRYRCNATAHLQHSAVLIGCEVDSSAYFALVGYVGALYAVQYIERAVYALRHNLFGVHLARHLNLSTL